MSGTIEKIKDKIAYTSGEAGTTGREPFEDSATGPHDSAFSGKHHTSGTESTATGTGAGLTGSGASGAHTGHGQGLTGSHGHHSHEGGGHTAGLGSGVGSEAGTGSGIAAAAAASGHGHGHGHSHEHGQSGLTGSNTSSTGAATGSGLSSGTDTSRTGNLDQGINAYERTGPGGPMSSGAAGTDRFDTDKPSGGLAAQAARAEGATGTHHGHGHGHDSELTGDRSTTGTGAATGAGLAGSGAGVGSGAGRDVGSSDPGAGNIDRSGGGGVLSENDSRRDPAQLSEEKGGRLGVLGTSDHDFTRNTSRIAGSGAYHDDKGDFKANTSGPGGNTALTGREGTSELNPVAQAKSRTQDAVTGGATGTGSGPASGTGAGVASGTGAGERYDDSTGTGTGATGQHQEKEGLMDKIKHAIGK